MWSREQKKNFKNSKRKIFENVYLGVYALQFTSNKRRVKEKGRIFLASNNAAEAQAI